MPTTSTLRVVRDCPVLGQPVLLSRDQVFIDYILLSEAEPTCSNIHACLSKFDDINNIAACLLHNPSKQFSVQQTAQ